MVWSLKEKEKELKPLIFTSGKSQDDVVNDVLKAISNGNKIIFIHGVCGTGKSAIALNIAKHFKKSSIVVPIKNLQRQYENDYTNKMHILKDNGEKLKIKVITGRNNHLCPFLQENNVEVNERNSALDTFFKPSYEIIENNPNLSCDNHYLPCTIEIKEKNFKRIREFLKQNPNSKLKDFGNIKEVKRLSIASICPYWCPITPSSVDLNLKANKRKYFGLDGKEFTFYQRKPGCGYYDQFNSYLDADVLIFNSQKYLIENIMDRKPQTDVEIIDECDEFLDSFSEYEKINLNRLNFSLLGLFSKNEKTVDMINQIGILSSELMKNPKVQDNIKTGDIIPLKDTPLVELLRMFLDHDLMDSVECDENNYCYHCDEVARIFQHFKENAYVSFSREDKDIIAKIVTINLEQRFMELMNKNKVFVMMSGTLHSEKILKEVFGISNFITIKAEAKHLGNITSIKTGKEMNCSYANFNSGRVTRRQYLLALNECAMKAKMPILIHVTSFNDLPTLKEKEELGLNIMNQERLKKLQENADDLVNKFKRKEMSVLYTTRCNRGIDFPGDMCNSIILTRYPYPNVNSIFWKILKKNKPEYYNELYLDKSRREVLQRIYRGLRSPTDHIFLLSPDSRVFENIKEFE